MRCVLLSLLTLAASGTAGAGVLELPVPAQLPAAPAVDSRPVLRGTTDLDVIVPPVDAPAPPLARAAPGADGRYGIDLLVLFTPRYLQRFGGAGGAQAEAQRLIAVANTYFDNSFIPAHYRLVGTGRWDGTAEEQSMKVSLPEMTLDAGVRSLRDRTGADLVILLRTMDLTTDLCGLAAGFNGLSRGDDPPQNVNPERDGFAAAGMGPNESGERCGDHVFAHELGHNLAGGHELSAYPLPAYWKPYSRGFSCGIAGERGTWISVMHAGHVTGTNDNYEGLTGAGDFFSSPLVTRDGMPCGIPAEAGDGAADNARAITEAAPYVAAYRGSAKAEAEAGSGSGALVGSFAPIHFILLGLAAVRARRNRKGVRYP